MKKKLLCPFCGYELKDDRNFNIELRYSAPIYPSDNEVDEYNVGSIDEPLGTGTIYCSSCGEEFDEFKKLEE